MYLERIKNGKGTKPDEFFSRKSENAKRCKTGLDYCSAKVSTGRKQITKIKQVG